MPTTSNFGWTTPADTDLVKDGALAIRTLGNGVDASLVDLKGGTTGQILSKASNTDLDYTWITNDVGDITEVTVSSPLTGGGASGSVNVAIQDGTTAQKGAVQLEDSTSSTSTTKAATPNSVKSAYDLAGGAIAKTLIDAEGDLIVGDAADAVQRLAIGSNGNVLTVDTSVDGKIKWAAAAGGGKLLQLVQGSTTTETTVSTNTYSDSSLTASITPTSATSKILVCITQFVYLYRNTTSNIQTDIRLLRGASAIGDFGSVISGGLLNAGLSGSVTEMAHWVAITYLDEPATTSSTTYKTQIRAANGQIGAQQASTRSTITLMEIGA